jgi:hypothetical protein
LRRGTSRARDAKATTSTMALVTAFGADPFL